MSKLRDAAQQALEALETVLSDAYHRRFPECCGRPGSECCGNPNEAWAPEDNKIMDALSPVQRQLSDALRTAQAEQPAEQESVQDEYNRVINHAIEQGIEASVFLRCWREGNWSGCAEFGFEPNMAAYTAPQPAKPAEQEPVNIGPEWAPCVKLPVTVHVRHQRPGETHVSTREGITPIKPDDLIMRGVYGEEYPIGREIFERTYRLGEAPQPAKPAEQEPVAWGWRWFDTSPYTVTSGQWLREGERESLAILFARSTTRSMSSVHTSPTAIATNYEPSTPHPQPKREPLTDEEIDNTTRKQVDDLLDHIYEYGTAVEGIDYRVRAIARAIERAHGIGEQA